MGCKALIYVQNTNSATYGIGSTIPFGSVVRRFGQNLDLSGNGIIAAGRGYYKGDVSVTLAPVAAGTVSVTLMKDGVAVPGATASATTDAAGVTCLSFPFVIREQCCDSSCLLTLQLGGAQSVLYNVSAAVERM